MPIVAQIAGFPGAGKTYLSERLAQTLHRSDVVVYDTDDLLWKANHSDPQKVQQRFRRLMLQYAARNPDKKIVFVGTFGFNPEFQQTYYAVLDGVALFWMDVPLELATERAIARYVSHQMGTPNQRIASMRKLRSEAAVSCLLNEQLNPFCRDATWGAMKGVFLAHGFQRRTPAQLADWIAAQC